MNETQVRTLQQVRQVLAGTQALEFRGTEDDLGRYAWIGLVLRRHRRRHLQALRQRRRPGRRVRPQPGCGREGCCGDPRRRGLAQAFLCDITDRDSVDAAVAATESALGAVDVLVNNAGWDVFKPFTKTEPAQWDKLIAINLTGALHMHHDQLDAEVQKWGEKICARSPTAIAIAKRSFNADTAHQSGIAGLGLYALKLYYDTEESREWVNALKDKRKPNFRKYAK